MTMTTKADFEEGYNRFQHAHDTHFMDARDALDAALAQMDAYDAQLGDFAGKNPSFKPGSDLQQAFREARNAVTAASGALDRLNVSEQRHDTRTPDGKPMSSEEQHRTGKKSNQQPEDPNAQTLRPEVHNNQPADQKRESTTR